MKSHIFALFGVFGAVRKCSSHARTIHAEVVEGEVEAQSWRHWVLLRGEAPSWLSAYGWDDRAGGCAFAGNAPKGRGLCRKGALFSRGSYWPAWR